MKRMQKGICMEVNGDRSVFMLNDGQFVLGKPVGSIDVGEEGSFYPLARKSRPRVLSFAGTAIAAVAIMMLVFTTILPREEAYAFVQVQVNPGVEIGIDEDNQVVSLRELNEDGLRLIHELGEWEHESLKEILSRVFELADVETADELTITTVTENNDPAVGELVETTVLAAAAATKNTDLNVLLKNASQKQHEQSVKENIPVGQLVKNFKKVPRKEGKTEEKSWTDPQEPVKQTENAPLSDVPPAKPKHEDKPKEKKQGEKKPVSPPGQEKKEDAPGQVKKKDAPPAGQEKKNEPVKENKAPVEKKEAPGQVKKEKPEKQQPKPSNNEGKGSSGNKENKGNGKGKE